MNMFIQGRHPEQVEYMNTIFITVGINGFSDEAVYYRYHETIECADRLSNCIGQFSLNGNCHSRYALHSLIQGPMFRNKGFIKEIFPNLLLYHHHTDQVFNMTAFDHAITSETVFNMPRVDLSVHMRMLFYNFENPDLGSTSAESQIWLAGNASEITFREISKKLRKYVLADMNGVKVFDYNQETSSNGLISSSSNYHPTSSQQAYKDVYTSDHSNSRVVYLAVDDLNVKHALFHYLKNSNETADLHLSYLFLNSSLLHSSRIHRLKASRQDIDTAVVGVTYDWLLLAFSKYMIGYRESDSVLAGRPNMGYGEDSSFRMSGRLFSFLPYDNLQIDPLQNNMIFWTSKVYDEIVNKTK